MILLTCDKDSSLMDIFLEHLEYIFFSCEGGSAGQGFWSCWPAEHQRDVWSCYVTHVLTLTLATRAEHWSWCPGHQGHTAGCRISRKYEIRLRIHIVLSLI